MSAWRVAELGGCIFSSSGVSAGLLNFFFLGLKSSVSFVFFRGVVDYLTYILTKFILVEGEVHKSRKDKTSRGNPKA